MWLSDNESESAVYCLGLLFLFTVTAPTNIVVSKKAHINNSVVASK